MPRAAARGSDDGKQLYRDQQWLDLNGNGEIERAAGEHRWPVSYVRNSKPVVKATFRLSTPGSASGPNPILARGTEPRGISFPEQALKQIDATTLEYPEAAATSAFRNAVDYYRSFNISWEISDDGGVTWRPAGVSRNELYVTLAAPVLSQVTPQVLHTVIHIGTVNAVNARAAGQAVAWMWREFSDRKVHRVDGMLMKYWDQWPALKNPPQTMLEMLASPTGNGSCKAWAQLWNSVLRVQGITGSQIIYVEPMHPDDKRFLVRTALWTFLRPSPIPGLISPYVTYQDARSGASVPAQGNNHSPDKFQNHFVVSYGGRIYDPSYGGSSFASTQAHENATVAGFQQTDGLYRKKDDRPGLSYTVWPWS